MIQQPYYTLADLDPEERQFYNTYCIHKSNELQRYKVRYMRSDLKLYLTREALWCKNAIKSFNQNLELAELGIELPFNGVAVDKWEYVYAIEHIQEIERELDKVEFIEAKEREEQEAKRREAEKTKNKRIKKFADYICDPSKVDAILAALHSRINSDTTGKQLGITIFAAEKAELITHPGFAVLVTEFGVQRNSGRKSDYAKYYNQASDGKIRSSEYENLITYFKTI